MIRSIKLGKGDKAQQISLLETPEIGRRNKGRKFLLMISGMKEEVGVYMNKEELQKLNTIITEIITEETNDGK